VLGRVLNVGILLGSFVGDNDGFVLGRPDGDPDGCADGAELGA